MTKNQLQYQAQKEAERNNRVTSEELHRHNLVSEALSLLGNKTQQSHFERSDEETQRSNRVKEGLQASQQFETRRHDLVSEQNDLLKITTQKRTEANKLAEMSKHNRNEEAIQNYNAVETKRNNLVMNGVQTINSLVNVADKLIARPMITTQKRG